MRKHNIIIYPIAQNDLLEIVDYLNTLAPQSALAYYDLLLESIGSLADMPQRCPLARDIQLKLRGYRTLEVKTYTAFYVVQGETVAIRRILYAKRQYEALL